MVISVCFKSAILNNVTFKKVLSEGQEVLLYRWRCHTLLSKGDNKARSRSPEHSSYLRFYCLLFASYDTIGVTLWYSSPWQVISQVCVVANCKVSAVSSSFHLFCTHLHPFFKYQNCLWSSCLWKLNAIKNHHRGKRLLLCQNDRHVGGLKQLLERTHLCQTPDLLIP